MRIAVIAAGLALTLSACATSQVDSLRRATDGPPSHGAVVEPVFYAQKTKECGPAALAMMLAHSEIQTSPDELVGEVYNPGREGSLTPALVSGTRRHGRIAYPVRTLRSLLTEVHQGRPVMVLQNLGLSWLPQWHYAVVVGYDLDRSIITLHSGTTEFLEMPMKTFEHTWRRGDYWGILTLRPGEFPEHADERLYVKEIVGVERAGALQTAAEAYQSALERWPDNLIALMGRGNTLYALGNHRAAAEVYRTATESHPDSADAYNNLGYVLGELGAFDDAEQAARTAVALGGDEVESYKDTLRDIQNMRAKQRNATGA